MRVGGAGRAAGRRAAVGLSEEGKNGEEREGSEVQEARGESQVREEGGTKSVSSGIQGFGESRNEGCWVGNRRAQKLGTWTTVWVSRRQGGTGALEPGGAQGQQKDVQS